MNIADTFESVIGPPDLVGAVLRHVDEMCHEVAFDFLRIDEMRHAEALTPGFLARIKVDPDDHIGTGKAQALNDVEANAAEAEDDRLGAGLHLGGVEHRTDTRRHPTADLTN